MKKISIIGCGLIGGSFAGLVKKHHPEVQIIGIGRRKAPLQTATSIGLIDNFELSISPSTIQTSDIIIIASPIATVLPIIQELTNTVIESKTIIEFSSVKSFLNSSIVNESHHNIVAMHPMGGLDVQGLEHASASVLEGCPMIIFDAEHPINKWIASCSFQLIKCPSYEIHDDWMMNVSHGPYILASALPHMLGKKNDQELSQLRTVSAGGFRDTTRVSNSALEWGLDILKGNKANAIAFINHMTESLENLKSHLEGDNDKKLNDWLTLAKNTRNKIAQ
jgi:prephenate dehydrogenase